jgi:hypothetical protein
MKPAAYILSFYLALLSVIPCCAFDDCAGDKELAGQTSEHSEGDEDCGSCSPFFNCEGCASVTVNMDPVWTALLPQMVTRIYSNFIPPFVPDVHYDFWQPPRLV